MVGVFFLQISEAKEILSIENVTIFGVLLLVIAGLVYNIYILKKEHERERKELRAEIKLITEDLKSVAEKYNVFTVKLFENYKLSISSVLEKLNTILNK